MVNKRVEWKEERSKSRQNRIRIETGKEREEMEKKRE